MTTITSKGRVAVGMSGGVDSSVAAALLLEEGYQVEGVTMSLLPPWIDNAEEIETEIISAALGVCEHLKIPHHTFACHEQFEGSIVKRYADEYSHGRTPNPCVTCNEKVKFGILFEWVMNQGFDFFATGHYAKNDGTHLMRGRDRSKDQSYFMYRIDRSLLDKVLFPLGDLQKSVVREYAKMFCLPTATRPESQGACFIGAAGRYGVVARYCPQSFEPGNIVTSTGQVVGRHTGIAHYTKGQRKGIGIGGLETPLYVVDIDAHANEVTVGSAFESSASQFVCSDFCIDASIIDAGEESEYQVVAAARYNMEFVPATLVISEESMTVTLQHSLTGVNTGQSIVCYQGEIVVAGGEIDCARL